MNLFQNVSTRFLPSVFMVIAVGLYSTAAPAKPGTFFPESSSDRTHLPIAYNAKRWPVYQKIHREKKPVKVDFASFEEKPDTATGMKSRQRKTRDHHRHTPYSRKHRR
jgi:hypothetical protein